MSKLSLAFILIGLLFSRSAYSQGVGIGFAYATSKSLDFEIIYARQHSNFKLGSTLQFTDTRGRQVDVQLPNYGTTTAGSGEYFMLVDIGYGRKLNEKILIDAELSFGTLKHYTNYIDNNFKGGGYHLVTKSESIVGIGVNAGYSMSEKLYLFTGFNSIRKFQFGMRLIIINSR